MKGSDDGLVLADQRQSSLNAISHRRDPGRMRDLEADFLAVFPLITKSNFVGCDIERRPQLTPEIAEADAFVPAVFLRRYKRKFLRYYQDESVSRKLGGRDPRLRGKSTIAAHGDAASLGRALEVVGGSEKSFLNRIEEGQAMYRKRIVSAILPGVLCAFSVIGEAQADNALVTARQKFFGVENVDANGNVKGDKIIASWASNTTYVVSVMGRVIMLDSYITTVQLPTTPIDRRRTPILPQEFVDLKPEAIFLGHGHGDHADNAAFIAKWTNATIYASAETCAVMQLDVTRMWNDPNAVNGGTKLIPSADPVRCVPVVAAGTMPGNYDPATDTSRVTRLDQMDPQVCILAFKFVHSGTAPVDTSFPHDPLANLGDPRYAGTTIGTTVYPPMFPPGTSFTPPANPALRVPGQMNTTTTGFGSPAGLPGGAITIFYQFIVHGGGGHNFTFAWINSAGPAKEGIGSDPGLVTLAQYNDPAFDPARKTLARNIGASLFALMDTLPPTDVLFGSIVSLGAGNNQQRDIILLKQHLKPKVYYPGHVDAVAQPGSALYHKINWRETATNMGWPQSEWPEFRLQIDPNDFMVPQVFDPKDARWRQENSKGNGMPAQCRGKA